MKLEGGKSFLLASKMQNGTTPEEGSLAVLSKITYVFALWSCNPTLGIHSKDQLAKIFLKKYE